MSNGNTTEPANTDATCDTGGTRLGVRLRFPYRDRLDVSRGRDGGRLLRDYQAVAAPDTRRDSSGNAASIDEYGEPRRGRGTTAGSKDAIPKPTPADTTARTSVCPHGDLACNACVANEMQLQYESQRRSDPQCTYLFQRYRVIWRGAVAATRSPAGAVGALLHPSFTHDSHWQSQLRQELARVLLSVPIRRGSDRIRVVHRDPRRLLLFDFDNRRGESLHVRCACCLLRAVQPTSAREATKDRGDRVRPGSESERCARGQETISSHATTSRVPRTQRVTSTAATLTQHRVQ